MPTQKDWEHFTDMIDIEKKVNGEIALKQQGEELQKIKMLGVYCSVWVITKPTSYPRTVEGCMDWIKAGKPTFAKKILLTTKSK